MTVVALGFVLTGTFLIIYSLFIYLQKDVSMKQVKSEEKNSIKEPFFSDKGSVSGNMPFHASQEPSYFSEPGFGKGKESYGSNSHGNQGHSYLNIHEAKNTLSEQNGHLGLSSRQSDASQVHGSGHNFYKPTEAAVQTNPIPDNDKNRKLEMDERSFALNPSGHTRITPGNTEDAILFKSMALYYEDHSSLIKYDGSELDLDPTLKSYKNFFRIGEGDLILTKNGISFQSMEHIFHIYFEDINNLVFYQNCLVILSSSEKVARIFFPDKYSQFRTTFRELVEKEKSNLESMESLRQKI